MRIILAVIAVLLLAYLLGLAGVINMAHFFSADKTPTFLGGASSQLTITRDFGRPGDPPTVIDADTAKYHVRFNDRQGQNINYQSNRINGTALLDSMQLYNTWCPFYKPARYSASFIIDSMFFVHFIKGKQITYAFRCNYQMSGDFPYLGFCSANYAKKELFTFLCARAMHWLDSTYEQQDHVLEVTQ